nr:MAG TPA: hypothetical protein [Caudoviricetes sp.]
MYCLTLSLFHVFFTSKTKKGIKKRLTLAS